MIQRTKLFLIIPHLGGGGAERVTEQLARHLDPEQFETHLCLITRESYSTQPIPRWIQVHRLQRSRVRHAWFQIVRLIRSEQPDVILSGMAHLNFLILLLKPLMHSRVRILVRQNTTASAAAQDRLTRLLYRFLYPWAHGIICQSPAMAADLAANFGIARSKLTVLANPVPIAAIRAAARTAHNAPESDPPSWPRLIAVGRLSKEKGMDLLLSALPKVREHYPRLHLKIFGSGPEEAALREQAVQLDIASAVTFAGYSNRLFAAYPEATLFVLPSRYEGVPNALLEAAAADLPLVTTPCSTGVTDLLENAPGAWLASAVSSEALAETLLTALTALQQAPGRFEHAFLAPFEARTSVASYAAILQNSASQLRR
jgi:glycosyltransferase involved in cell wall biosynthesis